MTRTPDRPHSTARQRVNEMTQGQTRIRENMKTIPPNSEYYQRLLKKLNDEETKLETLQNEVEELHKTLEKQRKDLENSLNNLSVG